jgi:kinesin family protein 6/9
MKSSIETYLRLKPLLEENDNNSDSKKLKSKMINYEIDNNQKNKIFVHIPDELRQGYVNNMKKSYEFKFTGIFEPKATQEEIFSKLGYKVIDNSLEGYNSTIFCYGQTGSGKTYTMCGKDNSKERGIIPRLLISFFNRIREEKNKNINYDVYISYIEIYNENAYDLFDKSHFREPLESWRKIVVYEDNYGNIMLKNMSMIKVDNEQQALDLLVTGNYIRHASSTSMNLASSRSHAIFSLVIEGKDNETEIMRVSKINLVDLAGSERLKTNNKNDIMFNETKLNFFYREMIKKNRKLHRI